MQYFSFLSTYANYKYLPQLFVENGEFKKDELIRFFLQKLENFNFKATFIQSESRDFFIIYSQEGIEDDLGIKRVSPIPPTFYNFIEEDIQEFTDLLESFIEDLKNDSSNNAAIILKEIESMKLAPAAHYIYFTNSSEED